MELATQYEKPLSDWEGILIKITTAVLAIQIIIISVILLSLDGHIQTNNWHGNSFQISNLIWLWGTTLLPGEKTPYTRK